MKQIFTISIALLISCSVLGQSDTLRENYSGGKPRYIYPALDGQYHGICKRWYPNGELWSEGNWVNGKQDGILITYFDNGEIQMKTFYQLGKIKKSKSYHSNGNKSLFSWSTSKWSKRLFWYESGKKLLKEKHRNGQPITCSAPISTDGTERRKEDESCYCGEIPVFWQDSIYVDSLGQPINQNYSYQILEWFENGNLKSKTTYKLGEGIRKEWNESGELIKDEKI